MQSDTCLLRRNASWARCHSRAECFAKVSKRSRDAKFACGLAGCTEHPTMRTATLRPTSAQTTVAQVAVRVSGSAARCSVATCSRVLLASVYTYSASQVTGTAHSARALLCCSLRCCGVNSEPGAHAAAAPSVSDNSAVFADSVLVRGTCSTASRDILTATSSQYPHEGRTSTRGPNSLQGQLLGPIRVVLCREHPRQLGHCTTHQRRQRAPHRCASSALRSCGAWRDRYQTRLRPCRSLADLSHATSTMSCSFASMRMRTARPAQVCSYRNSRHLVLRRLRAAS